MAKKKTENTLSYLQMPLPESRKYYKMTKVSFGGLNKRQTIDSGDLTAESNISTKEYPYLTPSPIFEPVFGVNYAVNYARPISMTAFEDCILVVYRAGNNVELDNIYLDYIKLGRRVNEEYHVYTSTLKVLKSFTEQDYIPRSIIQFNHYDKPTDPVTGKYIKKLLIYPDCKVIDYDISEDKFTIFDMNAEVKEYTNETEPYLPPDNSDHKYYWKNTHNDDVYEWVVNHEDESKTGWKISVPPGGPKLKYATVHLSRVFGVDDDRVYASGFNDYTNWTLDTTETYNEGNAWCSPAQSNTKAGGNFTGITTFQNHVVCFKRDFMHEIYNTKNPFRLQDIYAEGAIDNRTIQDVDGKLIFVSDDNVKIYTGSNPRIISYNLNMPQYYNAVSGTDNRHYYLYCEDTAEEGNKYLYVYDTYTDLWSERSVPDRIVSFAHNKKGMFMLCMDGKIYKIDTGQYNHKWYFETDLITNQTVDIKRIKKLQMLADIHQDATIKVYILYDNETFDAEKSHLVYTSSKKGKVPIRVKPRNTANYGFKLHVTGEGYAKFYELEISIESGGDMYV